MKNFAFTALIVVLIGTGLVLWERERTREFTQTLTRLEKDRDVLTRQVKELNRKVAEAASAPAAPVAAANGAAPAAAASATPAEPDIPGVTTKAPPGWAKNGSKADAYVVGTDATQLFGGQPSAYVRSKTDAVDGFAGMMQAISAQDYAGKRVRLSGWMKTQDANDAGGHLWMRVDGDQTGKTLQFDNMDGRAPKGTTDWQQYSVVLDVPPEAGALAFGFFLGGSGKVWVNGTNLEVVGNDVPSTALNRKSPARPVLPKAPANLTFGSNSPQ